MFSLTPNPRPAMWLLLALVAISTISQYINRKNAFGLTCRVGTSFLRHFLYLVVFGITVVSNLSQWALINIRIHRLALFQKLVVKNIRGIPEKSEKGF